MRDYYQDTIVRTDANGDVTALAGVKIEVYRVGNKEDYAVVYTTPDPENTTQAPNPWTTDSTGSVFFYADVGEYEIVINDQRVGTTGFRWNAVSAAPGGIALNMLGADVRRQLTQIGEVIDWFRPFSAVPLPAGFVLCDGHVVPGDEHDFTDAEGNPLDDPFPTPDLRNQFVVGADVLKPDASDDVQSAASAPGDSATAWNVQHPNAPGIGGTGGKNAAKNLSHTHDYSHSHGVPYIDHVHDGITPDHLHATGTLYTGAHAHGVSATPGPISPTGPNRIGYFQSWPDSVPEEHATALAAITHQHTAETNGNVGIGGATDANDRPLSFTATAGKQYGGGPTPLATTTTQPATLTTGLGTLASTPQTYADLRPAHVGLLKLMKVRRD